MPASSPGGDDGGEGIMCVFVSNLFVSVLLYNVNFFEGKNPDDFSENVISKLIVLTSAGGLEVIVYQACYAPSCNQSWVSCPLCT